MLKQNVEAQLKKSWFSWVMIILASAIYTIGLHMFVQVVGIFSAGIGAFAQLITMTAPELKDYFSLVYLALNVPLIAIFWTRLGKKFRRRTITFLLLQAAFGSLFLIHGVNDAFVGNLGMSLTTNEAIRNEVWPIFVLAVIGAAVVGIAVAISWKFGGSTAGADIIVYYYSTKKKQNVGTVMLTLSMIFIMLSFSLSMIIGEDVEQKRKLWLITLSSTMVYILITSTIVKLIYPKYKVVKVTMHPSDPNKVIEYMKSINYNHSYIISKGVSGYNGNEKIIIDTVMLLLETKDFIKRIKVIDPKIWILETAERKVHGNFDTKNVE